jgi:hypothetical protein
MAYRKAKGLCYKCGFKWGLTYKCNEIVPLYLVEELWQLLYSSPTSEANSETLEDSGDDLMALSANAVHGT